MRNRNHFFTTALVAAVSIFMPPAAKADSVTISLPQADISGVAGTTVGWGVILQSTLHYLTISNVSLLPGPSIGVFTDTLSPRYGFEVGPSPAPSSSVNETFNEGLGTGIASFAIDNSAPVGSVAYATLYVVYNLYNVSPNYDPGFDPFDSSHTDSEGNVAEIPVSITVVDAAPPAVPEPSTYLAVGSGLLVGAAALRRRHLRRRMAIQQTNP